MDSKSTLVGRCILLLTITSLTFFSTAIANSIGTESIITPDFGYIPFQTNVVTYRLFEAYPINNSANSLFWITENEANTDHFEIERSFDQKNFKTIGLIFGEEDNTSGSYTYRYNDKAQDLKGHKVVYYRLKQIELDGQFQYSVVKEVRFNLNAKAFIQATLNPYMEKLSVNFISNEDGKGEVRMINEKGQVVTSKQSTIVKGYNTAEITNLTSQVPGLYIVEIVIDDRVLNTSTVVKQ